MPVPVTHTGTGTGTGSQYCSRAASVRPARRRGSVEALSRLPAFGLPGTGPLGAISKFRFASCDLGRWMLVVPTAVLRTGHLLVLRFCVRQDHSL